MSLANVIPVFIFFGVLGTPSELGSDLVFAGGDLRNALLQDPFIGPSKALSLEGDTSLGVLFNK